MYIDHLQRTSARIGRTNETEENRQDKVWEANHDVEGQRGTILQQTFLVPVKDIYNSAFRLPGSIMVTDTVSVRSLHCQPFPELCGLGDTSEHKHG